MASAVEDDYKEGFCTDNKNLFNEILNFFFFNFFVLKFKVIEFFVTVLKIKFGINVKL